jgi:hypothetical protein
MNLFFIIALCFCATLTKVSAQGGWTSAPVVTSSGSLYHAHAAVIDGNPARVWRDTGNNERLYYQRALSNDGLGAWQSPQIVIQGIANPDPTVGTSPGHYATLVEVVNGGVKGPAILYHDSKRNDLFYVTLKSGMDGSEVSHWQTVIVDSDGGTYIDCKAFVKPSTGDSVVMASYVSNGDSKRLMFARLVAGTWSKGTVDNVVTVYTSLQLRIDEAGDAHPMIAYNTKSTAEPTKVACYTTGNIHNEAGWGKVNVAGAGTAFGSHARLELAKDDGDNKEYALIAAHTATSADVFGLVFYSAQLDDDLVQPPPATAAWTPTSVDADWTPGMVTEPVFVDLKLYGASGLPTISFVDQQTFKLYLSSLPRACGKNSPSTWAADPACTWNLNELGAANAGAGATWTTLLDLFDNGAQFDSPAVNFHGSPGSNRVDFVALKCPSSAGPPSTEFHDVDNDKLTCEVDVMSDNANCGESLEVCSGECNEGVCLVDDADRWHPAFLYVDVPFSVDTQVIHLDQILSEFQNGWGADSTRQFTLLADQTDVSVADGVSLHQTSGGLTADAEPLATGAAVSNVEGLIFVRLEHQSNPVAIADAVSEWRFEVEDTVADEVLAFVLRVSVYTDQCRTQYDFGASVIAPEPTDVVPPPPTAMITYNGGTGRFDVTVTAAYARNAVILVDFSPFDGNTDTVRESTNCDQVPDDAALLDLASSFASLWHSAPNTRLTDAASGGWPAYPATSPSTPWLATAAPVADAECQSGMTVTYTATFSLPELENCKRRGGQDSVTVSVDENGGKLVYDGSIEVTYVYPIDVEDEALNFGTQSTQFPFNFRFERIYTAAVALPLRSTVKVAVRSESVAADTGVLSVSLVTQSTGSGLQVKSSGDLVPDPEGPSTIGDPCTESTDNCVQTFGFTDPNFNTGTRKRADSKERVYSLEFEAVDDTDTEPTVIPVALTVKQTINIEVQGSDEELGAQSVGIYATEPALFAGGVGIDTATHVFKNHDQAYVRTDLAVADADNVDHFDVGVYRAQLCRSTVEGYTITNENGGCLGEFPPGSKIEHWLVAAAGDPGVIDPKLKVALIAEHDGLTFAYPNGAAIATGLSFETSRAVLKGSAETIWTLHVEIEVDANFLDRRSDDSTVTASSHVLLHEIRFEQQEDGESANANPLLLIGAGATLTAVALLVVLAIAMFVRRHLRSNREQHEYIDVEMN